MAIGLRTLAWITAFALAATMGSERMYWYWGGIAPLTAAELAAFYGLATAVGLFALVRSRGASWTSIFAAGSLFGLIVEGVITPVVYEDGPLPLLFFLFVWWHATIGFVGFVVLVRRWALDGRRLLLGLAAAATGVYWGAWGLISAVVDRETAMQAAIDGGSSDILDPAAFATYAGWVGLTLIGAHVAVDRAWPHAGWRPTRRATIVTGAIAACFATIFVIVAVPWAPVKFALLAWMLWRVLRHHGATDPAAPTVVESLAGHVRLRNLLPVAAMPLSAGVVYALLWPLRDAEAMTAVFWTFTVQQVVVGAAVTAWLVRPASRRRRPTTASAPTTVAGSPSRSAADTTWPSPAVRRARPAVAMAAAVGLVGACTPDSSSTPDGGAGEPRASSEAVTTTVETVETPETLDDASPPDRPSLLAPSARTHLGLTWFSPPDDDTAATIAEHWDRAQSASSVGRVLTDWIDVEPEPGRYRFDDLDDELADLVDAGLAPMVTIAAVDVSGTPFPEWLGDFEPVVAAEAYVSMVEGAAPMLASHGVWLLAIANEPPLDDELDLDDFATFVELVSEGVARVAPDLDVTFTFAGADPFIDDPAIDRMIDAVDAFSVNHYCLGMDLSRAPIDVATDRIDELVARAGDRPVVFQEFGCPAGAINGSSEADQLAWFDTTFAHIAEIEQIRAAFVFEFLDWSPSTFELAYGEVLEPLRAEVGDVFVDRFESWLLTSGLVRADGTTRPAFDHYLTAAASSTEPAGG